MFEDLCRKTGRVLIPSGTYSDGVPVFTATSVTYFALDETAIGRDGARQTLTVYYIRDTFDVSAGARFVTQERETMDLAGVKRLYDHFSDTREFYQLSVAKDGQK